VGREETAQATIPSRRPLDAGVRTGANRSVSVIVRADRRRPTELELTGPLEVVWNRGDGDRLDRLESECFVPTRLPPPAGGDPPVGGVKKRTGGSLFDWLYELFDMAYEVLKSPWR
jgi:hypothetical protein